MMKKICFLLISLFLIVSCNNIYDSLFIQNPEELNITVSDVLLTPIWKTNKMVNETVLFIGDNTCNLLFEPTGNIVVKSYDLKTTYTEGVDYSINGKTITRLPGSSMPNISLETYFPLEKVDNFGFMANYPSHYSLNGITTDRFLRYDGGIMGEGTIFTKNSICISYEHNGTMNFSVPEDATFKNKAAKVINNKGTVLFYGDSITTGCDSSSTFNVEPNTPSWPILIANSLGLKYYNTAVGGWDTATGRANFSQKVLNYDCDILVLAWGMNNMNGSESSYKTDMQFMVDQYLNKNPKGLVILVSPFLPNSLTFGTNTTLIKEFENTLYSIANQYDSVTVAPVTSLFKELVEKGKENKDYLSNNINHTNDFAARLYAQVILETMIFKSDS